MGWGLLRVGVTVLRAFSLNNGVHQDACGRPLSVQLTTNNGSKIVRLSPKDLLQL